MKVEIQTIHSVTIAAKCPNGAVDCYQAEFHIDNKVIEVEKIAEQISLLTKEPIFQEDLTRALAENLGCSVTTVGKHGVFETNCEASIFRTDD